MIRKQKECCLQTRALLVKLLSTVTNFKNKVGSREIMKKMEARWGKEKENGNKRS